MSASSAHERTHDESIAGVAARSQNAGELVPIQDVQQARNFIAKLYAGVSSSNVQLADEIEDVVGSEITAVMHLQRSLPAKFEDLLKGAEHVRDVLGARVVEVMNHSGLTAESNASVKGAISEMKSELFEAGCKKLLQLVKDHENEFTKKQGGYHQCMRQQEQRLRSQFGLAKWLKYIYSPFTSVFNGGFQDFFLGASAVVSAATALAGVKMSRAFCASSMIGAATCVPFTALFLKIQNFEFRTDFEKIQEEIEEQLVQVRKIKHMGNHMASFLKSLKEDVQTIQAHERKFDQLIQQLPWFLSQNLDVRTWNAELLSAALQKWDLPQCAKMFLKKQISGQAFMEVMQENDFKDLGIEDQLTLRRLKQLQEHMKSNPKELCRKDAMILSESLSQALNEVVACIASMKAKHEHNFAP